MAFSNTDDGRQERVILGFLFALVAAIVIGVIALVMGSRPSGAAKAPAAAPAVVTADVAASAAGPVDSGAAGADEASVVVDNGMVKFYFASGKADVAAGANEALADVVKAIAAGKRAVISGYHDASGNAAVNAEVSKQRAIAVRDALVALGVTADKVELKKPEETTAEGPASAARRVEVTLAD